MYSHRSQHLSRLIADATEQQYRHISLSLERHSSGSLRCYPGDHRALPENHHGRGGQGRIYIYIYIYILTGFKPYKKGVFFTLDFTGSFLKKKMNIHFCFLNIHFLVGLKK